MIRSSYIPNHFGRLIQSLVEVLQPNLALEIGILDGYSTLHIARGLRNNGKGKLYAFDLFERYPYKSQKKFEVENLISRQGLSQYIEVIQEDADNISQEFQPNSIDLMHVDISNDGETIKKSLNQWDSKLKPGGLIIFEGGSPLRDEIEWMKKYNRESISKELKINTILKDNYTFSTLHPFPSLTLCSKNINMSKATLSQFDYDVNSLEDECFTVKEENL
jgi:predicted O-methyltransferase YrrM